MHDVILGNGTVTCRSKVTYLLPFFSYLYLQRFQYSMYVLGRRRQALPRRQLVQRQRGSQAERGQGKHGHVHQRPRDEKGT